MNALILLKLGLIGALGFLCQWLGWRMKLPAILFLLLSGVVIGPVFGFFNPDEMFGELLLPLVSLAVAVILFEGSLTLKISELHDIGRTVRNMVTYGIFINALVTTLAVRLLTDLDWSLALLFGSIMVVTGPTVIVPMLKATRLNSRISRTLRWEGIIIDPVGALLAVLVFEFIVSQQSGAGFLHILGVFAATVFTGALAGGIVALLFGFLLRKHWIPEYLQNYAALAFVSVTFALTNSLMHESGLIAVTVLGIVLVNMPGVHIRSILHFKENLTTVLVSVLFIILAARIDFKALYQLGFGALGVLLAMQFIARPLKVFACTMRSDFKMTERTLLAWVGPRGIVAAAVCAAFALRLELFGVSNANLLVPLSFTVIIGTVLIQGTTARAFGRLLQVAEPDNKGILIIGSNPVSIAIARALKELNIHAVICDTYWDSLAPARMEGLDTYYGNPMSNHAELYLDKSGLGAALGLSYDRERNSTAALRFREEFGPQNVFTLSQYSGSGQTEEKHYLGDHYRGRTLFGRKISYGLLAGMISRGATIRKTSITEEYSYADWQTDNQQSQVVLLCMITKNGTLQWATEGKELKVIPGCTLLSLTLLKQEADSVIINPNVA
ncbi:MAG: sodium:proton antiporter [Exilibacterium sp.]